MPAWVAALVWPVAKALAVVAVVVAIVVLVLREAARRGAAERENRIRRTQEKRNARADEIRAESLGDATGWLARQRARMRREKLHRDP